MLNQNRDRLGNCNKLFFFNALSIDKLICAHVLFYCELAKDVKRLVRRKGRFRISQLQAQILKTFGQRIPSKAFLVPDKQFVK